MDPITATSILTAFSGLAAAHQEDPDLILDPSYLEDQEIYVDDFTSTGFFKSMDEFKAALKGSEEFRKHMKMAAYLYTMKSGKVRGAVKFMTLQGEPGHYARVAVGPGLLDIGMSREFYINFPSGLSEMAIQNKKQMFDEMVRQAHNDAGQIVDVSKPYSFLAYIDKNYSVKSEEAPSFIRAIIKAIGKAKDFDTYYEDEIKDERERLDGIYADFFEEFLRNPDEQMLEDAISGEKVEYEDDGWKLFPKMRAIVLSARKG